MKLIFLLQRNGWFIESGGAWSALREDEGINLALSTLPLQCVDEFDMTEQPLQLGYATVEPVSEQQVRIVIRSTDDAVEREEVLTIDQNLLSHVEWLDPPFSDGWVASKTRLQAENVRKLILKVYIPPVENSDGKTVLIHNAVTGSEESLFVKRGQENVLAVINDMAAGNHQLVISCDAEASNDSVDVRSLGFVLLDKVVEM